MPASGQITTGMGALLALLTLSCAATLGGGGTMKSDVDELRLSLDRLRQEDGFVGHVVEGRRFDIGSPEAYLESLNRFSQI